MKSALLALVAAVVVSAGLSAHSGPTTTATPRRPIAVQWGLPGDVPVTGDFDGDGKNDLAVFRPQTGQWFIMFPTRETNPAQPVIYQWGLPGDVPMAGDYDGDGITDLAVFRPSSGTWFISFSNRPALRPRE